jgi:uncharacterized protein
MKFRIVADTNVLVSHFILPGHHPSKILDLAAADKITLIVSEFILGELEGVLRRKFYFDAPKLGLVRQTLLEVAEMVKPRHVLEVIREDDSDNRILECALSAKAHFLISGDKKHLLPLKQFKGIQILSPSDFIRDFIP